MARQPAGPSSARGATTISTPTVPRIRPSHCEERRRSPSAGPADSAMSMGPSDCSSAITATFSVTIPTWNADRVTPLTRAPATARWCQRPRSAAQECRPTSAARPRRAAAATSRTPTKSSGETSRRPTRAVMKDELQSRTKT